MMQKNMLENIVFGLLGVILMFTLYDSHINKVELKKYQKEVQYIQKVKDSLQIANRNLSNTIELYKEQIEVLDIKIDSLIVKLGDIETETKDKVGAIDKYTNAELRKFFTDRYNKGSNGKPNSKAGN